jgi:hypothetical protein
MITRKSFVWGAHAPSRVVFGAPAEEPFFSNPAHNSIRISFGEAPKAAREARALPKFL